MSRPLSPHVLAQILVGLKFPADRWQIVAHVDDYGPDLGTRHLFWQLPERTYLTVAAVLEAMAASAAEAGGGKTEDRLSSSEP